MAGVARSSFVHFDSAVFDMDGVVTRTAQLHAAAWKSLFDTYLQERLHRGASGFAPFDATADYLSYVDGKPRYEGVQSFLDARRISLPEGTPADSEHQETICGLGNRKDALFERALRAHGAASYHSTVLLIAQLRDAGVIIGLVTSSRHGREVLASAGVTALFDAIVDGADADALGLKGKPQPDIFLAALDQLGTQASRSVVVEDAVAGVRAGRAGNFGLVIGVDRGSNREALYEAGADIVVRDLDELSASTLDDRYLEQTELRARISPTVGMQSWHVEQEGFDAAREPEMESIFTIGNGYLGVRGALDAPLPGSRADMFVAGIYDRKQPSLPYSELEFLTRDRGDYAYSELVPLPFPLALRIAVDREPLDLVAGPWHEHRRDLDLQRGVLTSRCSYEDSRGRRTQVETCRCASLAEPHLLMQELRIVCDNFEGMLEVEASIRDAQLATDHPHLRMQRENAPPDVDARTYRTSASNLTIAVASRLCVQHGSAQRAYRRMRGVAGSLIVLRRYVCVYTNRDSEQPAVRAIAAVNERAWASFDAEIARHEAHWKQYWTAADIRVPGAPSVEQALRFNAYHLRIAADHDPQVSVGARTLSGRAYEGHIFWDVEIFMLPFYVHTCPDIARTLLIYRHRTLDGARHRARELGFRGACYAWESTVTGADATPREILLKSSGKRIEIYTGFEQIHVSADVAYGVWRYFEATDDREFMLAAGAEILLETARFWASRCIRIDAAYHIHGVTGPDEYHHTVDDNAYTNWMARFNLDKALWIARWVSTEDPSRWSDLRKQLDLQNGELSTWGEVQRELYCPRPTANGVIEQFAGFFELKEHRLPESERFKPPLRRLFEADETNRRQLIKQADVLMLIFLFPEHFSREVIEANYRYYEPRTDHGSSLSPPVHAALAARLGWHREALRYWRRSLWLDLSNVMGNSALGVHAASMAATWQALVFGLLDLQFSPEGLQLTSDAASRLPPEWRGIELQFAHRGRIHPIRWSASGRES